MPSPREEVARPLGLALPTIAGGLVIGAVDATVAVVVGGLPAALIPGAWARIVGLWLLPLLALCAAGLLAMRGARRRGAGDVARAVFGDGAVGVAGILASVLLVGIVAGVTFLAALFASPAFEQHTFVALAATVGATVGLILGVALAAVVRRRLAVRLQSTRLGVWHVLGAMAACGLLILVVAMLGLRLSAAWITLPSMLAAVLVGGVVIWASTGGPMPRLPMLAPRADRAAVAIAVVASLLAVSVPADPRTLRSFARGRTVTTHLASGFRALTDFDGDGYGLVLGSSDCRPFDPAISPGAADKLGDGVDSDCSGGDGPPGGGAGIVRPAYVDLPEMIRPGTNVVLLTVDTVRPDHLASYGYSRVTMPTVDRLATEGVRFDRAYACSTRTFLSIPCLLFGRPPSSLRWSKADLHKYIVGPEPTLAAVLAARGYHTMAAMFEWHWLENDHAIRDGFAVWDTSIRRPNKAMLLSTTVSEKAVELIDARPADRPFFLWAHYIDGHFPWPRSAASTAWGDDQLARYDGVLKTMDDGIGIVVSALEKRGLLDQTLVVVTSDHGEEFESHGRMHHGWHLYEDTARILFVARGPGLAPQVLDVPVSNVDLMPSVLNLLGIQEGWELLEGWNFAPALAGRPMDARPPIAAERWESGKVLTGRVVALVNQGRKAILDLDDGSLEIYDLVADPGERNDLAGGRDPRALAATDPLVAALYDWLAAHPLRSVPKLDVR